MRLNSLLCSPLSLLAGALPPWCSQLVRSARFLFPFEARRRFFYCTSFGLARALHYLQQVRWLAPLVSICGCSRLERGIPGCVALEQCGLRAAAAAA